MNHVTCSIDDCDKEARRRGWCGMHYQRFLRHGDPLHTKYARGPLHERLNHYLDRSAGPDACWLWTGHRDDAGYGRMSVDYRPERTHRVAFYVANGYWPEPACLHSCDNPPCCNPAHLREGTQQENIADRDKRQRNARGETHSRAKVTEAQVRHIRRLAAEGDLHEQLAHRFGIAPRTVTAIVSRTTWRHVA